MLTESRINPPPLIFRGLFTTFFTLRRIYLLHLALPRPNFLRLDVFTEKPNEYGRNFILVYEGTPFYVQPTVWNRWGPAAWFKWALGQPLPGDSDKFYPQGYYAPDLGPKYFEGKGRKELEVIKEGLRERRRGQCPF